jgi:RND superfamily putative drug exporter
MIAVFLSFALSDQRIVKEFGIGLAFAIFVDATVVRLVLVPSLMQLMGRANWWMPPFLDRLIPRIGVEGPVQAPASDNAMRRAMDGGAWHPVSLPGDGQDNQ